MPVRNIAQWQYWPFWHGKKSLTVTQKTPLLGTGYSEIISHYRCCIPSYRDKPSTKTTRETPRAEDPTYLLDRHPQKATAGRSSWLERRLMWPWPLSQGGQFISLGHRGPLACKTNSTLFNENIWQTINISIGENGFLHILHMQVSMCVYDRYMSVNFQISTSGRFAANVNQTIVFK